MTKDKLKGHLAILGANVIWGLMAPASKMVTNSGEMSALTLAAMRIAGGAALFWLLSALHVGRQQKIERGDWPSLIVASLLITFINQMLVINGVGLTSPIDASVMCSTTPIITLLMAWIVLRDKPGWHRNVGVAMGFAGILCFTLGAQKDDTLNITNPLLGNVMCLTSQVCAAYYFVRYRGLTQKYSPFTLMKWLFLISCVPTLLVAGPDIIATEWTMVEGDVMLNAGYVVFFGTFLAYILMPMAQKTLKPTAVAMYNYLQPVVSMLFSLMVGLGTVTWLSLTATLLIFAGVGLVNRK